MLKEAGISLNGLFLNADSGFDSKEFKEACQKEEIIPNVKPNTRNSSSKEHEPHQSGTRSLRIPLLTQHKALIIKQIVAP